MIDGFNGDTALGVVYWAVLVLVVAGSLVTGILASRRNGRVLITISSALLVVGVAMVSPPHPHGPGAIDVLLSLAALVISAFGGSPAVRTVLQLATRGRQVESEGGGILIAVPETHGTREILRGGITVGVLERLATTGAILAGMPDAIAVIIAIKGVGRFSELGASEAQERFIIGTFVSLGWAVVCGALAHLAG